MPPPPRRSLPAAALVLTAIWAAALALWAREGPRNPKVDAMSFYAAGIIARSGSLGDLYRHTLTTTDIEADPAAGAPPWAPREFRIVKVFPGPEFSAAASAAGYRAAEPPVFVYLPAFALLLAPASLLPWPLFTFILDTAGLLLLGAGCGLILSRALASRFAPRLHLAAHAALLAILTLTHPVQFGLYCGQISTLMAGAIALTLAAPPASAAGRAAAGALHGVLAALKVFPVLTAAHLALSRRWTELIAMAAVAAAIIIAIPGPPLAAWAGILADMGRGTRLWVENQSLDAALNRLLYSINATHELGALEPRPLSGLALLLGAALLAAWAFRWARPLASRQPAAALPAALSLMVLFAILPPVAWTHYGAFILPGLVYLAAAPLAHRRLRIAIAAAAILALVIDPGIWRHAYPAIESALGPGPASMAYRALVSLPLAAALAVFAALLVIAPPPLNNATSAAYFAVGRE